MISATQCRFQLNITAHCCHKVHWLCKLSHLFTDFQYVHWLFTF